MITRPVTDCLADCVDWLSHCKLAANNRCQIITPPLLLQLLKAILDAVVGNFLSQRLALLMSICSKHHQEIHHWVSQSVRLFSQQSFRHRSVSGLWAEVMLQKLWVDHHQLDITFSSANSKPNWHCVLFYRTKDTHGPKMCADLHKLS